MSTSTTARFADRWARRQERNRATIGTYLTEQQARIARGEYQPGDRVNGYVLSTKGVWLSTKKPFSNLAWWLATASLIFTPLVIVALVLAAVAQSKNEEGADSVMTFAVVMGVISLVLFVGLMSTL